MSKPRLASGHNGKPTLVNGVIEQYFGNARPSWIDCEDVAAVAAVCLRDAKAHHGQTYPMGYDAQSLDDVANILTSVIGMPFRYDTASRGISREGVGCWSRPCVYEMCLSTLLGLRSGKGSPPRSSVRQFRRAHRQEGSDLEEVRQETCRSFHAGFK